MITQENNNLEEQDTRSSTEIESGIRRTRERMDATLDELGNRLNPRSLMNSAMDWWEENKSRAPRGETAKHAYRTLTHHVKENPMPSALIGAGLVWMLLNAGDDDEETGYQKRGTSHLYPGGGRGLKTRPVSSITGGDHGEAYDSGYEYSKESRMADNVDDGDSGPGLMDKVKDKAHEAKDAVTGLFDTVKDRAGSLGLGHAAGEAKHRAQDLYSRGRTAAEETGHSLQHTYESGIQRFEDAMEEYPLAIGAAFIALGALTGVLLPRTRREDRLLGEQSDRLMETAREKGADLLERGKAVAGQVAETAMEEAREKGITVDSAAEKLSELAGKTGEVIRKAAEDAGAAVKNTDPVPAPDSAPAGNASGSGSGYTL